MKKIKVISFMMLTLITVFTVSACGDSSARNSYNQTGVSDVLQAGIEEAEKNETEPKEAAEQQVTTITSTTEPETLERAEVLSTTPGIDIDLTMLSSTMVYSEVYNMMLYPEEYIGKTVRMKGAYATYHDQETGQDYFSCIIQDATACCAQGIEFELTEEYAFPEDYPNEADEITVVGEFDNYREGQITYNTLRNATLVQ